MTKQDEEKLIELLQSGECIRMLGVGNSMRPLLRNGLDYAYIKSCKDRKLKIGDVILYRKQGKLILHRIVGVNRESFSLLGDGNTLIERDIRKEDILGAAIGFERKGYYFPTEFVVYSIYWHLWIWLRPVRPFIKKINIVLKKVTGRYEDEDQTKEKLAYEEQLRKEK